MDGWMYSKNRLIKMDYWMDSKKWMVRWMVRCMDRTNRWMVG